MKMNYLILTFLMSMAVIGLQAQSNTLQGLEDTIDKITKSKDDKEKKRDDVLNAVKSYTKQFDGVHEDGPLEGQPLMSPEQVNEVIAILKKADTVFDSDGDKYEPKSRGGNQDDLSVEECFTYALTRCSWCTTVVPGYVIINGSLFDNRCMYYDWQYKRLSDVQSDGN